MSSPSLRFVHASDFHLEQPPHGIADIPVQLRDAFVDAAYNAVEKIVDAVLAEEAEMLVLSGDILAADDIGPRSLLFLIQQFERLADRGVLVYWSRGPMDPADDWPSASMFPSNVHRFTKETTQFIHHAKDQQRARLIGTSGGVQSQFCVEDFEYEDDGLFTIALAYGQCDPAAMSKQPIDYWAMGGSHQKNTVNRTPSMHYPGSPQGRCPAESGPHGCTLVEVDSSREVIISPLITDVLRWETNDITVDGSTDFTLLEQTLRDHMQRLIVNSATQHLLVSWNISGTGPLIGALRRGTAAADIVAKLRAEFGNQTPCAWTVTLDSNPPASFSKAWYDEESILGEFLRNVRELQANTSETIDLESLLGEGSAVGEVAGMIDLSTSDTRANVLRRASALGVQMLSGDEERYT